MLANKNILPHKVLNIVYAQMFTEERNTSAEEEDLDFCALSACLLAKSFRNPPLFHERLNWEIHVKRLIKEGEFSNMYRMHYESFCKLVQLLSPALTVDVQQSKCRSHGADHIYVELILHCLLRYMAGGSFHDICVSAGLARSTFFSCLHHGIKAVNSCKELSLHFPKLDNELKQAALEFQSKSHGGVLDRCIAALDGWLCRIRVPASEETLNKASYFSGHYQCHGLNVQPAYFLPHLPKLF